MQSSAAERLDIGLTPEIYEDEVALAKVVHTLLEQEVLREALLKVDTLLVLEVDIDTRVNFELLLAETNGLSHTVS